MQLLTDWGKKFQRISPGTNEMRKMMHLTSYTEEETKVFILAAVADNVPKKLL